NKTEILSLLNTEIEDAVLAVQDLADFENDNVEELIIDLTMNLLDPAIEHQLSKFNHINDTLVLTEDVFSEEQIINIVLNEQQKLEEGDASDTDNELPEIPIIEGLNGLKKFIGFVEQQQS
ncbi:13901_t:CDS:1, partial [Cetraspora pellucida]